MRNEKKEAKAIRQTLSEHPLATRVIFATLAFALAVLVIWGCVSAVLAFFSVEEIEVRGESRYSVEDIISKSGIRQGDRLYYLGSDKRERELLDAYPYLESVRIISYFPNRVIIEVSEYKTLFIAEHKGGACVLNERLEVLEIVSSAEEASRSVRLELSAPLDASLGEIVTFEDSELASAFASALKGFEYYDRINKISVKDKHGIYFVFDGKYKIITGNIQKLDEKLNLAMKIFSSSDFNKDNCAVIDARDTGKLSLRYVEQDEIAK